MLLLSELTSAVSIRLPSGTDFVNFLANKSRSEQKEHTTFAKSLWGISERKTREINVSSMCHIFVISRGIQGHPLLKCCISNYRKNFEIKCSVDFSHDDLLRERPYQLSKATSQSKV